MLTIEGTVLPSVAQWEMVIFGMRNPLNSWGKIDSEACYYTRDRDETCDRLKETPSRCAAISEWCGCDDVVCLGNNDLTLARKLAKAGSEHAKYRRMLPVWVTINAPLYWWKEFDTYKVGTVANSCSTMHKIHSKLFEMDDFSHEHLYSLQSIGGGSLDLLADVIASLNHFRECYLKTKDKKYWWQMIQLLPQSYNQKRTVMLNYEVLANMYRQRKDHKLDEWREFCAWIESLPYAELITGGA